MSVSWFRATEISSTEIQHGILAIIGSANDFRILGDGCMHGGRIRIHLKFGGPSPVPLSLRPWNQLIAKKRFKGAPIKTSAW